MTFDQEIHPRIEFKSNPLKVVVVQLRFPALYGLTEPASLAALQAALGQQFPTALPRIPQVTVTVGPGATADTSTDGGPVRFVSQDGASVISVAIDWISFETTAYVAWVPFRSRFEELVAAIPEGLRPARITRIGLRYVDQIQAAGVAAPSDWRRYIQASLLGPEDSLMFDERLIQGLQQLSFRIDDDGVNVRHGYLKNDAAADAPSTYVIDTDIFTESEQPFDVPAILERIDRYHGWCWNLFRRSITPAAVELLGGTER